MYVSCLVILFAVAFLLVSLSSSAALLTDPSQLKEDYDFIVIGGELHAYKSMNSLTDQRKPLHSRNRWKCNC
jgi:hypothetical protein